MTYRDFSTRQIQRHRKRCEAALQAYQKRMGTKPIDRETFQAAYSVAFMHGCNHLEKKYAHVGLFNEAK